MKKRVVRPHLVLVGGGHAHVQVLRAHGMKPLPYRITVVVDRSVAVYSGMVPGVVAGQYRAAEVEIDVRPLARRVGAAVIEHAAVGIDPVLRRVQLLGRPPLAYDVASIDIGSTVAGKDLPGVQQYTVPTRPIGRFLERLDARLQQGVEAIAVVGGGAGGVELAACLRARTKLPVTLVAAGPLVGGGALGERVQQALSARGVEVQQGRAVAVSSVGVSLEAGSEVPADLVVWVAGAAALPVGAASGLPTDDRGFIWVDDTLEVSGCSDLFAVGDCAVLRSWPEVPKAGVYAVRQGPVLIDNLRRRAEGRALGPYVAQRHFFSLLNLGDGTAIGTKWGFIAEGRSMFAWKDRIDRAFMDKFQVLSESGVPSTAFTTGMPAMPAMDTPCGGCAAKVAAGPLERALGRLGPVDPDPDVVLGLEARDDAVAVRHRGGLVVANVDAFTAFTDDDYLVGQAAALNAISDLQVKGVSPRHAMALVQIPDDRDAEESLFQVLAGARSVLGGSALLGGHTTEGSVLSVGFAVWGFSEEGALWRRDGLQDGDVVVLSGPLGTGVLWRADMWGLVAGPGMTQTIRRMVRGHTPFLDALAPIVPHGATDVTGFGLARHLMELLQASAIGARVSVAALPAYPGAIEQLRAGVRSTFHPQNQAAAVGISVAAGVDPAGRELLFDPQTCGPVLVVLAPQDAADLVAKTDAVAIGTIRADVPAGTIEVHP